MKLKSLPIVKFASAAALMTGIGVGVSLPAQASVSLSTENNVSTSVNQERLNLTPQQQIIISTLNISPNQEAQLQQIEQPLSFHRIEPVLTLGQRQQWLQERHAYSSGH
jgi:hypothetical protein